MERSMSRRARRAGGRARGGYGLPSLAVALFVLAVVVQAAAVAMVRGASEAKADAAFNISREHLEILGITGAPPDAEDFPHLAGGSRFVTVVHGGGEGDRRVRFAFVDGDPRAAALYRQKLRSHLNIPNARALGDIFPGDIRAPRPERVLRAGDRMAAPLRARNIVGAGLVRTGTGAAEDGRAGALRGAGATFIEAARLRSDRVVAGKLDVAGGLETRDATLAGSLVTGSVNVEGLVVNGRLNAVDGVIADVAQTGQFAPLDGLAGVLAPSFGTIAAAGLRASEIRAGAFQAGSASGGAPRRGRIAAIGEGSP